MTDGKNSSLLGPEWGTPYSKKVQVLLSTYNGAAFLEPLLKSVLAQDHAPLELLVRDDGSTDETVGILERYAAQGKLSLTRGANLGFARSFLTLAATAPEAEFYAFCDQDDIWEKDKISRAVESLSRFDPAEPLLYGGRYQLVDESLQPIATSPIPSRGPSFANALVQCIAPGCTLVFNAAARRLLASSLPPEHPYSHDWWIYLVISAMGRVVYDPVSKILYRQHGGNVIGHKTGLWDRVLKRLAGRRPLQGRLQRPGRRPPTSLR